MDTDSETEAETELEALDTEALSVTGTLAEGDGSSVETMVN